VKIPKLPLEFPRDADFLSFSNVVRRTNTNFRDQLVGHQEVRNKIYVASKVTKADASMSSPDGQFDMTVTILDTPGQDVFFRMRFRVCPEIFIFLIVTQ